MTPAPLEFVEQQSGDGSAGCVIWLHGLGADGWDFVPVVDELHALGAPALRYVFPHAPTRPVTINGGYVMRAWYDILGMHPAPAEDAEGIRTSQAQVEQLIEQEVARGTPRGRIVLAGFSQGCAIALHTGLRQSRPLAGIVALSGYLPLAGQFDEERAPASAAVPVFMAHGRYDPVVAIARGIASRDRLAAVGQPLTWHEYPMEHSVCPDELRDIARFLAAVLPA